ncbi:hypothetical protein EDD16DRAFT_1823126 [Pisolithus croceorrhizus]|nr:hypothetical protein EDD16DRAFT_1823126 [Pisolithus croceorrhizus]KAI6163008.1 hypothetical protein EDD17DRAFT_1756537 [Pisolithus thermaeus]
MEYNPRYPQPFTLEQAIALDPEVASDEIGRLQNSIAHLQRTQNELRDYTEDSDVRQAIEENKVTMRDERIFMLKLALTHHGIYQGGSPSNAAASSSWENTSELNSTFAKRNDIEGDSGIYL